MSYADRTKRPPRTMSDAEQGKLLRVSGAKKDDFRDHLVLELIEWSAARGLPS